MLGLSAASTRLDASQEAALGIEKFPQRVAVLTSSPGMLLHVCISVVHADDRPSVSDLGAW
jgi:hypothetical protein